MIGVWVYAGSTIIGLAMKETSEHPEVMAEMDGMERCPGPPTNERVAGVNVGLTAACQLHISVLNIRCAALHLPCHLQSASIVPSDPLLLSQDSQLPEYIRARMEVFVLFIRGAGVG